MRKFLIKVGLILTAAAGLFIWFRNDASVLAGAHPFGMIDRSGWVAANSHNPDVLNTLESANTGVLFVEIPWEKVEKNPGAFSWQFENDYGSVDLTQLFGRLQRHGIEPVAVLSGGPMYLSHLYPQQPVFRDQLLESLQRFAGAAAEQFGSDVQYWQIGTAINNKEAWGKVLFPLTDGALAEPDPILYSEMLRNAYSAIKEYDSRSTILMGGLEFPADCAYHPTNYLQAVADQDAWYAFDIASLGLPTLASSPETATFDACGIMPSTLSGVPSADSVQAVADALNGIGKKPLWVGNLQFSAPELVQEANTHSTIPEAIASDWLARASALLRAFGSADRVIWSLDPLNNTPGLLALQTYANLSTMISGRFAGSTLPDSMDAYALRFKGGGRVNLLAWYTQGGLTANAMMINGMEGYAPVAYSADSDSLKPKDGITLPVDDGGNIALMVSERPVLISGHPKDIKQTISQAVADSIARASDGMKAKLSHWLQAQKAKAAIKVSDWAAKQQASLLDTLRVSLEKWIRKSLGLA